MGTRHGTRILVRLSTDLRTTINPSRSSCKRPQDARPEIRGVSHAWKKKGFKRAAANYQWHPMTSPQLWWSRIHSRPPDVPDVIPTYCRPLVCVGTAGEIGWSGGPHFGSLPLAKRHLASPCSHDAGHPAVIRFRFGKRIYSTLD